MNVIARSGNLMKNDSGNPKYFSFDGRLFATPATLALGVVSDHAGECRCDIALKTQTAFGLPEP
jgi:hypothetical protein